MVFLFLVFFSFFLLFFSSLGVCYFFCLCSRDLRVLL